MVEKNRSETLLRTANKTLLKEIFVVNLKIYSPHPIQGMSKMQQQQQIKALK